MRPDTLFRIASMTKPITAIGIMMLADEGKLAVDDPVEKHLPEFRGQMLVAGAVRATTITLKKPPRPITLRDLLTHTSGLPGTPPPGLADLYAKRNHTLAEAVMAYSQRPLDFEPGSRWAYCNAGIDTLGRIIEVVSGQSLRVVPQGAPLRPAGHGRHHLLPDARAARAHSRHLRPARTASCGPPAAAVIGPPAGAKYPIPAGGPVLDGARPRQALPDDAQPRQPGRPAVPVRGERRRDDPDPDRRPQDGLHRRHGLGPRLGRRPHSPPASPSGSRPGPTATAAPSAPRPGSTPTAAGSSSS